MSLISPQGPVYQAGTLSGNPLAMEMGIRQLTYLKEHPEVYETIDAYAKELKVGLEKIIDKHHYPCQVHCCGSLLTLFFKTGKIEDYHDAIECDLQAFERYYQAVIKKGLLLAPSQFEVIFISYVHSQEDLKITLKAMEEALEECFQ